VQSEGDHEKFTWISLHVSIITPFKTGKEVYSKVTERKTAIDALLKSDLEYDTKLHQSSIRGVY
jgi:hypothetical protein